MGRILNLGVSAAAIVFVAAAAQTPLRTITAFSDRALTASTGKYLHDVSWSGADALLIATDLGVYRVNASGGTPKQVINNVPLPDGLPDPTALASDGQSVSAISWNSNGGFALRLGDRKRLEAQSSFRLIPMDVAVLGSRACVVGFAPTPSSDVSKDAAVWCGSPSDSWRELKPLHYIRDGHAKELFQNAPGSFGGRIAIEADGTVDVITSAQPGVFRYASNGTFKEVLGKSIDDLVLESMAEIRGRFANDLENRYRLLLNVQPVIDDLVVTPTGPAIVVRIAAGDKIHWELWYPQRSGGVGDRLRLGIERIGPYGHLRCDARGADLACAGSQPPRKEASSARTAQAWPHLWLFHFPANVSNARR